MTALLPVELTSRIESLVANLAAGDFASVQARHELGRVSIEELERVLSDYGNPLVPLPAGWQEFANVYGTGSTDKTTIDVDLWTEEGRSDLTLSLTAARDEEWKLAILDLRVL